MSQFTKKPVTIEAVQYMRRFGWPNWFHQAVTDNKIIVHGTGKFAKLDEPCYAEIVTLEGTMRADENDWIIQGVAGEIYPCKPDIFEATYSPAKPRYTVDEIMAMHGITEVEEFAFNGLQAMQKLAHATATARGWYNDKITGEPIQRNVGEVIALMHSELSEALEAWRVDAMDDKITDMFGIEVEFADTIIRILDTAAALNLQVPLACIVKNRLNAIRKDHSLAERAKAGGKKI